MADPQFRCETFLSPIAKGQIGISNLWEKGDAQPMAATPLANGQLDYPRTLAISCNTGPIGEAFTNTVPILVTVYGISRRKQITETFVIPAGSNSGDFIYGVKVFTYVTEIRWTTPAGWTDGRMRITVGKSLALTMEDTHGTVLVHKSVWMDGTFGDGWFDDVTTPDTDVIDCVNGTWTPNNPIDGVLCYKIWYEYHR